MANIRTFDSAVDQLRPTEIGGEAYDKEGRHIEAAYSAAGAQIGGAIEKYQTLQESAGVMKQMSDLEVKQAQDLDFAKNNMTDAQLHDPNAVQDFTSKYQDEISKIGENLGTKGAQELFARSSNEFNTRASLGFIGVQSRAAAEDTLNKSDAFVTNYANLGNQDPNHMQSGIDAANTFSQTLEVGQRAAFNNHAAATISDSTAEGIVGRVEGMKVYDPAKVAAASNYINDPANGFSKYMSPSKFAEVNNRLDNAKRSGANTSVAGAELNFPAMYAQTKVTGEVSDDLKAGITQLNTIGTPEALAKAAEAEQNVQDAQAYYKANQAVIKTPAGDRQSSVNASEAAFKTATGGADISAARSANEATTAAWKARDEAFHGGDPVKQSGWALENIPAVKSSYADFQANPNADTFQKYAQTSYGNQKYLEPGVMPSLLTEDMRLGAQQAVNDIARDDKAGPQTAVKAFNGMANLYGQFWPQIAGDLQKKGVFNGDQAVMADVSSRPGAAGWVEQLARASVMKPDVRENQHGVTWHDAQVAVRAEIGDLASSMGNMNNGGQLLSDRIDAAAKVYQVNGLNDANTLVQSMFLDQWQFTGNNKTIRIPSNAGLNADAIGSGSKNVLNDIGNHDLVVPPSLNLGAANQKELWADSLKANGVWFTKPDGSGATLYDGAGTANPVMEVINGKTVPVTLDWKGLQKAGAVNQIKQSEIERREMTMQQIGGH